MNGAATKPLFAVILFLAGGSLALGQAGSTGGAIGQTDKSLSGVRSTAEPSTATRPGAKGQRPIQSSDDSVAGRWRWDADCTAGRWQGEFDLVQASGGNLTGSFAGTSWHDVGAITDGHINGNSVTFTRTNALAPQFWRGQLAAGRMKGTVSGNANCSWEATRK